VGGRRVVFFSDLIIKTGDDAVIYFELDGEDVSIRIHPMFDESVKDRTVVSGVDPDDGNRGLLKLVNWGSSELSRVSEYVAVNLPDASGDYSRKIYLMAIVGFFDDVFNIKIQMTVNDDE
jgi:hypothetical protein